jgi:ABC-type Fe3+ transport system substrate-binding protein
MGKPRQKNPPDHHAFAEEFVDWMGSPQGQTSIEVSDVLWELMAKEDVQLDARQRKILWPKGKSLSIDQSIQHIHKLYPKFPSQRILSFLISWIEQYAPETYSEKQLDELDQLTEEWIDQYEGR